MPYTSYELSDMFRKLPQDVREAFGSVEYTEILDELEKKYSLHIDQAAALSDAIYKLMLGIIPPQEFITLITDTVKVPRETGQQIATEVNEKIFRPVRESMMRIHNMNGEEGSMQPIIEDVPKSREEIPEPTKETPLAEKKSPDPYRESAI